ncbi:Arylsulfatase [Planctomycetes bacterium Poly30]|uniref:Arylsulfatase n=1 Tax=Saltatorellus ferox TaxID=2528018 RepID=A0A518EZA6_9BACT|nr:Arylsulfatase [Planctomycetes bacterium Poly30]
MKLARNRRSQAPRLALLLLCTAAPGTWASPAVSPPGSKEHGGSGRDVVLIVADDIGLDRVGAYRAHPAPGRTPNIDRLAASGLRFNEAWSNPLCSPTRATILTGRYSFRTRIGWYVGEGNATQTLDSQETLIPEAIASTHASFAFGKWHLAKPVDLPGHPLENGFLRFSGTHFNLNAESYYRQVWYDDLVPRVSYDYVTTLTTDAAIQIPSSHAGPRFIYVAYHAPHTPFEAPPDRLHHFDLTGLDPENSANAPIFQRAMIEAMDTEIGRLIAAYPQAIFIFVGDNGNTGVAVDGIYSGRKAKRTLYQGGIAVPLIIAEFGDSPTVVTHRGSTDVLVNTTDLYATVLEITGHTSQAQDSVSLVPYLQGQTTSIRQFVWAEQFRSYLGQTYVQHVRAVRNARHKLIRDSSVNPEVDELYDLIADPLEEENLIQNGVPASLRSVYRELDGAMYR